MDLRGKQNCGSESEEKNHTTAEHAATAMKKLTVFLIVLAAVLASVCLAFAITLATCITSCANTEMKLACHRELDLTADVGSLVMRKDGIYRVMDLRADTPSWTVAFRSHGGCLASVLTPRGTLVTIKRVTGQGAKFDLCFWTSKGGNTFTFERKIPLHFGVASGKPYLLATEDLVCILAANRCAVVPLGDSESSEPAATATEWYELGVSTSQIVRAVISEMCLLCCTETQQLSLPLAPEKRKLGFMQGEIGFLVHNATKKTVLMQLLANETSVPFQLESLSGNWSNLVQGSTFATGLGSGDPVFIDDEQVVFVSTNRRLVRFPDDVDLGMSDVQRLWGNPLTSHVTPFVLVQTGEFDLWIVRVDHAQAEPVLHADLRKLEQVHKPTNLDQLNLCFSVMPLKDNEDNDLDQDSDHPRQFALSCDEWVMLAGHLPRYSLDGGLFLGVVSSKKLNKVTLLTEGKVKLGKNAAQSQLWNPLSVLLYDKSSDSLIVAPDFGDSLTRKVIAETDAQGVTCVKNPK
jgi:hypothetical protein